MNNCKPVYKENKLEYLIVWGPLATKIKREHEYFKAVKCLKCVCVYGKGIKKRKKWMQGRNRIPHKNSWIYHRAQPIDPACRTSKWEKGLPITMGMRINCYCLVMTRLQLLGFSERQTSTNGAGSSTCSYIAQENLQNNSSLLANSWGMLGSFTSLK